MSADVERWAAPFGSHIKPPSQVFDRNREKLVDHELTVHLN